MIGGGPLPTDKEARDWADYFVIATSQRASSLHLPGSRSSREEPRPLCGQLAWTDADDFISKDLDVFPPGHRDICRNCLERLASRQRRRSDD